MSRTKRLGVSPLALFAVKNGIGFGHLRRSSLIAQTLDAETDLLPVIISQARSTRLLEQASIRTVNFPRLNRCSSVLAEDAYDLILGDLLGRLRPRVLIEDTYPDRRYALADALLGVPRLLVARRLDAVTLDTMIDEGAFSGFDEVLMCQSEAEFNEERHSSRTQRVIRSSGRFRFVGPIWRRASVAERIRVRQRYASENQRLIVVSVGAGGDKYLDGFASRLVESVLTAATAMPGLGKTWVLAIIAGPYYPRDVNQLPEGVIWARWEPELPALLAAADVVVIKPGSNCLLEALDGSAQLIMIPDRSYREALPEYAERIAARYDARVVAPEALAVGAALRRALSSQALRAPAYPDGPATQQVAARIAHWGVLERKPTRQLSLGVLADRRPDVGTLIVKARPVFGGGVSDVFDVGRLAGMEADAIPSVVVMDDLPRADANPHTVIAAGALFAALNHEAFVAAGRWLWSRGIDPALYLVQVNAFRVRPGCSGRLKAWLASVVNGTHGHRGVVLIIDPDDESWPRELAEAAEFLGDSQVQLRPLSALSSELAQAALRGSE